MPMALTPTPMRPIRWLLTGAGLAVWSLVMVVSLPVWGQDPVSDAVAIGLGSGLDLDPRSLAPLFDLNKLLTSAVLAMTAILGARLASATLERLGEKFTARRLLFKKLASLTRFLIYLLAALVIVLGVIRPERDTLLALSTALIVTVGLALKDLTSSIIAGVIVLVDSPFQVGDRVRYGDTYGEVVEIGLRTVKINTLDDDVVSIPNNKFLTDAVSSSNAGELDMMIVLDFHVGVTADHELARQLVFEAAATSRYAFLKKPILVTVEDVSVGGIYATQIRARFYVADTRYELEIRSDVASRVKQAFHDHGVHPPNLLETGLRLTTTPG